MDGNYNLRSRRNKKEDEDNLLPDDPLLPDGEEDPLFPSDDDLEACEVEDCKNQLPTQLCIPCDKYFCPFHLPTANHNHITKTKGSKKRCEIPECRKKLPLACYPCHCGRYFCSLHMPAEKHGCDFDYQKDARKKLKKKMPKVVGPKIRKL